MDNGLLVNAGGPQLHIRFEGRSIDVPQNELDIGDASTDDQIRTAVADHLGAPVSFYRTEGNGGRITLILPDGSYIYVDQEDIDFKFECVRITVMMDEEERAAFEARVKEIKENMDEEYGY